MNQSKDISNDWVELELGSIAKIIDPHPSHRAPDAVVDGIPFAGIGDLTERGELISNQARVVPLQVLYEHQNRYKLSTNSIGFGRVATIGKVIDFRLNITELTISPTMAVIEPFGIDRNFLLHSLRSTAVKDAIDRWLTGTTRSSLGIELLRKIPVKTPSRQAQKKIAAILTTIDTAIEKTEALIEKYQQIKAGLMHDLFTRGVLPNGQLRPPREQAPELYQETAIGWIPKDWKIDKIGSVLDSIADGPFGSNLKTEHYVIDPGVRVVRLQNISEYEYDDTDKAYISGSHANFLVRNKVVGGDVLVAGLGEERYPVGRACCYPMDLPTAINKADCFRIRCNCNVLQNKFFMLFMNSELARKQIRRYEQGVTRPRINTGNLKRLVVSLPSIQEQAQIITKFEAIQLAISRLHNEVSKLNQQKYGLMQDLLTGRVLVKVDNEVAEVASG